LARPDIPRLLKEDSKAIRSDEKEGPENRPLGGRIIMKSVFARNVMPKMGWHYPYQTEIMFKRRICPSRGIKKVISGQICHHPGGKPLSGKGGVHRAAHLI